MYVKLSRPDMQYLKVFESELELALKKCRVDGAKHGKEQSHRQAWGSSHWLSSGMRKKSMLNVKAAT